ncbi:MAG: hypothetical protein IPM97_09120 [Bdellovibrionaceae bacterium]|jgi:uncharacterized membrane protein YphA (DoxX/SURF4 family)|nr:hypothetical protein [Pseudobdellovibrionaceae bacterium]
MMEWLEIGCRWALGLQLLFWGLNDFFKWKAIPKSADFIDHFTNICVQSKFIMPSVKTIEIVFGFALLTGYGTLLALVFLGPIVFLITGLHLFHNKERWSVIIPITGPYLLLLFTQQNYFLGLFY